MDFKSSKRKLVIGSLGIVLAVGIGLLVWRHFPTRRLGRLPLPFDPTRVCWTIGTQRTYASHFPLTENPISEHGNTEARRQPVSALGFGQPQDRFRNVAIAPTTGKAVGGVNGLFTPVVAAAIHEV
jgi:hypothetical protein